MSTHVVLTVRLVDDQDGNALTVEVDPSGTGDPARPVTIARDGVLYVSLDDLRDFRDGLTELLDRYGVVAGLDEVPF